MALRLAVGAVVLSGAFVGVAMSVRASPNGTPAIRVTGLPALLPTSLANLMGLSAVPARGAPAFHLVDQTGHPVSLDRLKGHAIVMEFMDPHCTDICPLVAQEFIGAYRELGTRAAKVDFVAVNVNARYRSVANVQAFSRERGLDTLPTWHFLTGSVRQLEAVWHLYGIFVAVSPGSADIVHTSVVYFIDPSGRERYLGAPTDDHTSKGTAYLPPGALTAWERGIALVAGSLAT